jgi:hypothetical protein
MEVHQGSSIKGVGQGHGMCTRAVPRGRDGDRAVHQGSSRRGAVQRHGMSTRAVPRGAGRRQGGAPGQQ